MESKKILILSSVWPEPNSSAAGSRILQLIGLFKNLNYQIVYASTASESEFMFNLEMLNVEKINVKLNSSDFDELLREMKPEIVLFDRFMIEEQFGWRISLNCPDAIMILDSEDLHFLRKERHTALKENKNFDLIEFQSDIVIREIASIYRCDLTLIISEYEIELLKEKFNIPESILFYLPLIVNTLLDLNKLPKFEERKDYFFIGNFLHEPNWDTVLYLKNSIWPLIKKLQKEAVLNIYGAYPSQKVYQIHNKKEGFNILGRAESTYEVFTKSRILLAPIRFGAGLKGKLIESMEYGTPSVTTNIGAEGMHNDFLWNGFIENSPESIAEKAVELYNNKNLWQKAQLNGVKILNNKFLLEKFESKFLNRINDLILNKLNHRKNNFIGAILRHHTLRSNEYMSRWIEEKNKNVIKD